MGTYSKLKKKANAQDEKYEVVDFEKEKEKLENRLKTYDSPMTSLLELANNFVFKNERHFLKEKYSPLYYKPDEDPLNQIGIIKVTQWVFNKNESIIDKLKNVYNAFAGTTCSISMVIKRKCDNCEIYVVVFDSDKDNANLNKNKLQSVLRGNFPGAKICDVRLGEEGNLVNNEVRINNLYSDFFEFAKQKECNNKDETERVVEVDNDEINQPKEYFSIKDGYCVATVTNVASEKSEKFLCQGIEKLIDGIIPTEKGKEYTIILLAKPCLNGEIEGIKSEYMNLYSELSPYSTIQTNEMESLSVGESNSFTSMRTRTTNVGVNIGFKFVGVSAGYAWSRTVGSVKTESNGASVSNGKTFTHTNYVVQHILKQIEEQMKRLEVFESLGMWSFATYVVSKDSTQTENVASMYRSLTQGEKSLFEKPIIHRWTNTNDNKEDVEAILSNLICMQHPIFALREENENGLSKYTSTSTFVSGIELAEAMNFPSKSVPGLPVIECVEFGRDVISYDNDYQGDIKLGKIYHMHNEENTDVKLNQKSLASHTFITGSTGSGKSNTVFTMLNEALNKDVKFLVVEPAKGEYKNVFGGIKGVHVYGTNPKVTDLLRLNPFEFPKNISVSEHIDRLIEIFNVCWPMYAAMPAILKDSVIRAYENAGWNMDTSENKNFIEVYPTFADVLTEIKEVLKESDYSSDNKGDYTGALVTRLKSLTNGINGQIFSTNPIGDSKLFDENVIVDLSRVGSPETLSMIMGVLVLKLQEYRISEGNADNSNLKHLTVLEEAHNILKRTSTEQSNESSNLIGKSVEMLTNAIAEMRSFGEGFIIADQSPGLLDMAAIRNTNTKIIHRLPDFSDRELVGKAAALNDDQIVELAKLQCGVAAVYQNDWINPVLCKVEEFKKKTKLQYDIDNSDYKKALLEKRNIDTKLIEYLLFPNKELKIDLLKMVEIGEKSTALALSKLLKNSDDINAKKKIANIIFNKDGNFDRFVKDDKIDIAEANNYIKNIIDIESIVRNHDRINTDVILHNIMYFLILNRANNELLRQQIEEKLTEKLNLKR